METADKKLARKLLPDGSALILTVVLTSLLAIVGVLFVMVSRVDRMATSSISEYKELNFAVDSVIAKISQELALDVPGVAGQEYYDYPGVNDTWLASLQPAVDIQEPSDPNDDIYYWPQISDINDYLADRNIPTQNVNVDPLGNRKVIQDHPNIQLINGVLSDQLADSDGDGIADSKWIIIDDITFSKQNQIFAAVRIIDNSAMLNINTAFDFNPRDPDVTHIDGSSQMQIKLSELIRFPDDVAEIHSGRCGSGDQNWVPFQNNVIWHVGFPGLGYLPFDLSDELELRYRYCINSQAHTRFETLWYDTLGSIEDFVNVPYDGYRKLNEDPKKWRRLDDWCLRVTQNLFAVYPDMRHLITTYNIDRIINPIGEGFNGGRMVNINGIYAPNYLANLSEAIWWGLYNAGFDDSALAAQIAVNIKDYVDPDSNVTNYNGYFGFESPCIYISEFVYNAVTTDDSEIPYKSYAIELYNPYPEDEILTTDSWRIIIYGNDDNTTDDDKTIDIDVSTWLQDRKNFYVIRDQDDNAPLTIDEGNAVVKDFPDLDFTNNSKVELQRKIDTDNDRQSDTYIEVESWYILEGLVPEEDGEKTYERDIKKHKCIRRLWDSIGEIPTLGKENSFVYQESSDSDNLIQAHPANKPFTNIGEIGMIFCKSAYSQGVNTIGPSDTEATTRVNLADPKFHQLFKYLTVFDPSENGLENETRIKGRININTAPWFVIAQLPWITHPTPADPANPGYLNRYNLAKAIVAYRDKGEASSYDDPGDPTIIYADRTAQTTSTFLLREEFGFETIGELATVVNGAEKLSDVFRSFSMRYYMDQVDQPGFPDLTTNSPTEGDGATDDFEERDLIFSRISNLVTVRSDVFTAYILVRIGTDGPQKRVLAILDRSGVTSAGGRVKILALHPVPDPR